MVWSAQGGAWAGKNHWKALLRRGNTTMNLHTWLRDCIRRYGKFFAPARSPDPHVITKHRSVELEAKFTLRGG